MPERGFLIFLLFFQNFLPQVEYERNSGLKFFSLFLSLSQPVLPKNNTRKRFFDFFCYFSRNFLARVDCERNSGLKPFSLLFNHSQPFLDRNNAGIYFFIFLEFCSSGWVGKEFGCKIYFSLSRPISSHFG